MSQPRIYTLFPRKADGTILASKSARIRILRTLCTFTYGAELGAALQVNGRLRHHKRRDVEAIMVDAITAGLRRVKSKSQQKHGSFVRALKAKCWTAVRMLLALGLIELQIG